MKRISGIIIIFLILALSIGGLCSCNLFKKKLKLDEEKGAKAVAVIENAQYKPDVQKYISANFDNVTPASYSALSDGEHTENRALTTKEFNALVDKYATIKTEFGAGKYQGYDIHEIKEELKFVLEQVPAFNQWFELPIMREYQGFISIPYYEGWNYYVEISERKLSVTRRSHLTRCSYLDFENRVSVENYEDETYFAQYEVMKVNYYFDENDCETMECYVYNVGVDHVKEMQSSDSYSDNPENYHPLGYTYLKNVKDKEFIKYQIVASPRYKDSESFGQGGVDLRGNTPYGIRRQIMVANYDGYQDVDVLDVSQQFESLNYPTANGSINFDITSSNAKKFALNVGLSEQEYENIASAQDFMDVCSRRIVDNFELKNEWHNINTATIDAPTSESIKGPFYGQKLPLQSLNVFVDCKDNGGKKIEFYAGASVPGKAGFVATDEYSLNMAIRNKKTGEINVIAKNNSCVESFQSEFRQLGEGSLDDYQTNMVVRSSALQRDEAGEYELTCAFMKGDEVVLDTLCVALLRSFVALSIDDVYKDGNKYSHYVSSAGGKLTITVTCEPVASAY